VLRFSAQCFLHMVSVKTAAITTCPFGCSIPRRWSFPSYGQIEVAILYHLLVL